MLEPINDVLDRFALTCYLFVTLLLHVIYADMLFSPAEQRELAQLFTGFGVHIGVFDILLVMLLYWTVEPLVKAFLTTAIRYAVVSALEGSNA